MADKIKVSFLVDKELVKKLAFSGAKSIEEYDELLMLIDNAGDEILGSESDEILREAAENCFAHTAIDGIIEANPNCKAAMRLEEEKKKNEDILLSTLKEIAQDIKGKE